jgi:hypothetical protein
LTLPSPPSCSHWYALRSAGRDRFWVPVATMRLYFAAASTALRPSHTLCESGFSMYASLPAWQAHTAISECQWLGVAVVTASTSLSSSSFRRSA